MELLPSFKCLTADHADKNDVLNCYWPITLTGLTALMQYLYPPKARLPYQNTACVNKCDAYSVNTGAVPIW